MGVRIAEWRECVECGCVFFKVGGQCPDCGSWDTDEISSERANELLDEQEELVADYILAQQELEDFEGCMWDDMEYL